MKKLFRWYATALRRTLPHDLRLWGLFAAVFACMILIAAVSDVLPG